MDENDAGPTESSPGSTARRLIGLVGGPVLFAAMLALPPPEGLDPAGMSAGWRAGFRPPDHATNSTISSFQSTIHFVTPYFLNISREHGLANGQHALIY